jgi:hypothetical protein
LNKLEVVLEELKNKVEYECLFEDKNLQNIECQEQSIAIIEKKKDKIIQLKDVITNFRSKYIVKLPFKDILGIRILVKIKLTPHITYKILALVDTGCMKNIIHDKYFIKCPELVHTIYDIIVDIYIYISCYVIHVCILFLRLPNQGGSQNRQYIKKLNIFISQLRNIGDMWSWCRVGPAAQYVHR